MEWIRELIQQAPAILRDAGSTQLTLGAFFLALGPVLIIWLMKDAKAGWKAGLILAWLAVGLLLFLVLSKASASAALSANHGEADYVSDETTYVVDFAAWKPVPEGSVERVSPVTIIRRDRIRKVQTTDQDYVLPFYTTGLEIEYRPIRFPVKPLFEAVASPDDPARRAYQYRLPIAKQPVDFESELVSRFVFWNGFRNEKSEWWAAAAKYPTERMTVVFKFPETKPCKQMEARVRKGQEAQELVSDNQPSLTDDGLYAFWSGSKLRPETRTYFYFDW